MKTYIKLILSAGLLSLLLFQTSCSKEDYLTDTGLHQAQTPLDAYDYLAAHPYHYFDTLLTIIDHYNLKEEVNSAGTFFAPTDRSVNLFIRQKQTALRLEDEDAVYTLESLFEDLPADSVKQYLFNEKMTLDQLSTTETTYNTLGTTAVKIQKVLQTDAAYYTWSTTPVYFLYYIKDVGAATPTRVQCQTTGILTKNGTGTILHVLANTHVFSSFTN